MPTIESLHTMWLIAPWSAFRAAANFAYDRLNRVGGAVTIGFQRLAGIQNVASRAGRADTETARAARKTTLNPLTQAMTPPYNGRYLYLDKIYLMGVLNKPGARLLTINEGTEFSLGMAQFLVLLALACHSLRKRTENLPIQFQPGHGDYLSGRELVNTIEHYLGKLRNRPEILEYATETDITNIIRNLRIKLKTKLMNPLLLMTGPGNQGYRLEVPHENVRLHYVDPDSGQVYDIPWGDHRFHT